MKKKMDAPNLQSDNVAKHILYCMPETILIYTVVRLNLHIYTN